MVEQGKGCSADSSIRTANSSKGKRTSSEREPTAFQRCVRACFSTGDDEFVNPRLEVRRSEISCPEGAGMGLFSRSVDGSDNPVFRKGEAILTLRGPLALRKVMNDEGRSLEWLYDNNHCCGLNSSGRVAWFCEQLRLSKSSFLEVGCWPTNLAAFTNNSCNNESANIALELDKGIPARVTAKGRKAKDADIPLCRVIATKDIPPAVELCWSYSRDNKDKTDYEGSYQIAYDGTEAQKQTIIRATLQAVEGAKGLVVSSDIKEFHKRVWIKAFQRETFAADYSSEEMKWVNLRTQRCPVKVSDAVKNKNALTAYIKSRLAMQSDIAIAVKDIHKSINSYRRQHARLAMGAIKTMCESRASVYQFCVDSDITTPESNLSFPLGWLTKKLVENPEDTRLQQLLIFKLRFEIVSSDANPVSLSAHLNKDKVPNFLYQGEKWTELHIETITGAVANRTYAEEETEVLLQKYRELPRQASGLDKRLVVSAARRGNHGAAVEVVRRYLEVKDSWARRVSLMKNAGLQLMVKSQLVDPTISNLVEFAIDNFSPEFCEKYLGLKCMDDDTLLDMAVSNKKRSKFSDEVKYRIATRKDKALLKKYLKMTYEKRERKAPSYLLEVFQNTHFPGKPPKEYTHDDLLELFNGDKAEWLNEVYPERWVEKKERTLDELIHKFHILRQQSKSCSCFGQAIHKKILERCKTSYDDLCTFARYKFTFTDSHTEKVRNGGFKRLLDGNGIVKEGGDSYSFKDITECFGQLPPYPPISDEETASVKALLKPSSPST